MGIRLLVLLIGYLIGSISPAFILGKILKGIDIRKYGTRNAGTTNAKKVLGVGPAVIVALFDLSKGLLSMFVAHKMGAEPCFVYGAGFFAILGHVFPFYLRFKGGQGIATTVGIILFLLIQILRFGWFPFESLIVLAILSSALLYITKTGEIIGLFVIPSFLGFLYLYSPFNLTTGFLGVLFLYILLFQFINIHKFRLLKIPTEIAPSLYRIRTILRPLAILFVVFYFFWGKKIILTLIGAIALIFIVLDAVRLINHGVNLFLFKNIVGLFKKEEEKKFSSMTLFLVACFVTILIFEKNIAMAALTFLVFGDFFARIFGLIYGRKKFLGKTLEGSIAYFAFSMVCGYFLSHFIAMPFWILFTGALTATITEAASPFGIDDNFTVALISASVMYATKIF